ncbi:MAG: hypothetical protein ACP5NS_00465 [Candidatus Pacearchaeota archaeon]
MNHKIFAIIFIALLVPLVSAANLNVEQIEKNNIIITELENANATFKLKITNNENRDDQFQIYSLVSVGMYPKEFFTIEKGETIILDVTAAPYDNILRDERGVYAFEYQIKGKVTGFFKDTMAVRLFDVKDAVDISFEDIEFKEEQVRITVTNKEKVKIPDLRIIAKSKFFEFSQVMDLNEEETKEFDIPITLQKQIEAGEYEVEIRYELNDKKSSKFLNINYLEESGLSVSESSEGFIVKKQVITKTNEGNIPATAVINVEKNTLTRLFTVYSDKPTSSERRGVFVDYTWEKELGVGESYTVEVTTNYTFPFIILLFIIAVGVFVKFIATGKISVKKRVSFVRTRGGEFALKIALRVKAHKNVSNVVITDRIPGHAKVFNKFGIQPHRIDEATRKLEWDITHLTAGEERVFTYIIYSKINIIGSFELPAASIAFEHNGKREHVFSNKTYFAAETTEN